MSSTRYHAVGMTVVHQHGAEICGIVHDFAGMLHGDSLRLTQLRILVGELIVQFACAWLDYRGAVQVHTEFRCPQTDFGFIAQDGQVDDAALKQAARRFEDAIVVPFGKDDAHEVERACCSSR